MAYIIGQSQMVITSQYRIWAERGFVHIEDKKTGEYKKLLPEDFKRRLDALVDLKGNTQRRRELDKNYPMLAEDSDLLARFHQIYKQAWQEMVEIRQAMRSIVS